MQLPPVLRISLLVLALPALSVLAAPALAQDSIDDVVDTEEPTEHVTTIVIDPDPRLTFDEAVQMFAAGWETVERRDIAVYFAENEQEIILIDGSDYWLLTPVTDFAWDEMENVTPLRYGHPDFDFAESMADMVGEIAGYQE